MKKLIFSIVFLLILLTSSITYSFAQTPTPVSFFDTTPSADVNTDNSTPTYIELLPFTNLIIQAHSFTQDVNIKVYQGIFDNIKTLLPADQTPVSSYSVVASDTNGKEVAPVKPIEIKSYNNYVDSITYFYPLTNANSIDLPNSEKVPGPVYLSARLPIEDSAFVVAVNKNLTKSDHSLNPKKYPPNSAAANTVSLTNLTSMEKLATLIVLVACGLIIAYQFSSKGKRRKKK